MVFTCTTDETKLQGKTMRQALHLAIYRLRLSLKHVVRTCQSRFLFLLFFLSILFLFRVGCVTIEREHRKAGISFQGPEIRSINREDVGGHPGHSARHDLNTKTVPRR